MKQGKRSEQHCSIEQWMGTLCSDGDIVSALSNKGGQTFHRCPQMASSFATGQTGLERAGGAAIPGGVVEGSLWAEEI